MAAMAARQVEKRQWIVWNKETGEVLVVVNGVPKEVKKEELGVRLVKREVWPKLDSQSDLTMWTAMLPEEIRRRAVRGEGKRINWERLT